MQGQRKHLNARLNVAQDTTPDNRDISQSASRNELNLQSDFMGYAGVEQDVRMLRGKGSGESSSSSKEKIVDKDDGLKMERGWPYYFGAGLGSSSRSEEVEYEKSMRSMPTNSAVGHNIYSKSSHCAFMPQTQSNSGAQRTDQIPGCMEENHKHWQALRENVFSNLIDEYEGTTTHPITPAYFNHFGSSPGTRSYSVEEINGSGSSIGGRGQSTKRKLHEGSSRQSYPIGASGSVTQNQNSLNNGRPCNHAFDAINFPLNPYMRINDSAGAQLDASECNLRSFYSVRNLGYPHDSESLDSSFDENVRRSNVTMFESSSQPRPYIDSLRVRSAALVRPDSRSPHIDPEEMYISHPSSGVQTVRRGGNSISRSGDSLTLRNFSPNPSFVSQDEDRKVLSAAEFRNMDQDPTNLCIATRPDNPATSASSTCSTTSPSLRPLSPPPPWICQQNLPHNNQRFPGFAPWTLFQSHDTEIIINPISHSPPLPSLSPSATSEAVSSRPSSHNVQQAHRRLGSMPERQDDAIIRLPHLLRETAADLEGRRMLFSEVLGGVRIGDNIQVEDDILLDPLIYHGLVEIHDRHRDMRLDVDNMSYEELLALEERIGDVNTGLSEKIIRKIMKQHKHIQETAMTSAQDVDPCCVCQEEFLAGEDVGKLDCGHDFHVHCIKKWLMLKNICPICKTMGLAT